VTPGTSAASSTLTVTTSAATPMATSTLTITGTSGVLVHSTTVALGVSDFSIAVSPNTATVSAGQSATYSVAVQPTSNFGSSITLSCSGLPTGATCSFNPASVTPGTSVASSTLTVTTSTATPMATDTLTITGTSGALVHSNTVALVVSGVSDFSIAVSPPTATVNAGQSASHTVTVQSQGGFSSQVSLSCSGLPSKATCSFSTVAVAGGSGTSTLTITNLRPTFDFLKLPPLYAIGLSMPGLALIGAGLSPSRKRVRAKVLLCLLLLGLIFVQVRCGGSSNPPTNGGTPGTPAGTYTIAITGTSGTGTSGVQHSATVMLTVH
jgi:hypothetical protein